MFAYWFLLSLLTAVTVFGAAMLVNMVGRRWWLALPVWVVVSTAILIRVWGLIKPAEWSLYTAGWVGDAAGLAASRWLERSGYPVFRRS